MWVLDLLMISFIILFVIDISGFVESLKRLIGNGLLGFSSNFSLKPFDCSLCMTWWVGLIYLILTGNFTILGVFVVAIVALLTLRLKELTIAIVDLIGVLINKIIDYASKV